jgi:ketosteroid isomerase-like protein
MTSTSQSQSPADSAESAARTYLVALQNKDKDGILSILTDDFVFEVPFNDSGTNDLGNTRRGITEAMGVFERAFREIETMTLEDLAINAIASGTIVFAEAVGNMTMANGRPYKNRYIYRFDLRDGKISRMREYRNPVTAAIAFGRPLPRSEA